ncbi:MAG: type IV secretory system conjugative DNA transfer family protein [Ruminococcus sp.]|nr:type IV secretory system conjugative DNA transfer family protein [Ruminococcus sp.]
MNELSGYILAASDSSPFQLPFFNALGGILLFHVKVWWVYLSTACIVFIFMTSRNRNDFKNMEHGSARWANKEEIKRFQKDKTGIPLAKDTYLPLKSNYAANLNEVVIGGSGAGKSFRKAKPDIIQMNGSYVITDPKGELYRDCAKVLKKNGYKIRVLNLVNVNFSNSYNPFAYVTSEQDVVRIANLFMKNTAGEGEKADFFSEAAGKLLVALMLYLFKSENEIKTFGRVIRLLNSIRYTNGSIDQSCELARCMNKHASRFPNDAASINWSGMQGNAQETQSSINEVLSTRLQLWATTDLDAITSTDEMDFESIGKEKTAIFLIIPAARNPYKAVINIFYCQLFETLMRVADRKYNGSLPLLVNCELDEFANIGEIPDFNETGFIVKHRKKLISFITALNVISLSVSPAFAAAPSGVDTSSYSGMVDIVFWVATIAIAAGGGIPSLIKLVQGQADEDSRGRNAGIAGLVITGAVIGAAAAIKSLLF